MSDEKLANALEKYKLWVLLNFVKYEMKYELVGDVNDVFLNRDNLLKVRCSSISVEGMSIELMEKEINNLIKEGKIKGKQLLDTTFSGIANPSLSSDYAESSDIFKLTPEGYLYTSQKIGRCLRYEDFIEKDGYSEFPKSLKLLTDKIVKLVTQNMDKLEIQIKIVDEIILNFDLFEQIKQIIGIQN